MSATVITFPQIAPCPHCLERFRSVALPAHLDVCPALAARIAHPSNHPKGSA